MQLARGHISLGLNTYVTGDMMAVAGVANAKGPSSNHPLFRVAVVHMTRRKQQSLPGAAKKDQARAAQGAAAAPVANEEGAAPPAKPDAGDELKEDGQAAAQPDADGDSEMKEAQVQEDEPVNFRLEFLHKDKLVEQLLTLHDTLVDRPDGISVRSFPEGQSSILVRVTGALSAPFPFHSIRSSERDPNWS